MILIVPRSHNGNIVAVRNPAFFTPVIDKDFFYRESCLRINAGDTGFYLYGVALMYGVN